MERLSGPTEVRVINVIEVKAKKGLGIEKDPVREITQYWDMEGRKRGDEKYDEFRSEKRTGN